MDTGWDTSEETLTWVYGEVVDDKGTKRFEAEMKNKQEIIDCLNAWADYYWQIATYYKVNNDIWNHTVYKEVADSYYKAAHIVRVGFDRVPSMTIGEFSHLKYGEMP